ncbi:glycosyltransferase [Paenibacillus sinopodophylli]|uniref:glycosyltransferase n=1 Tax=Paenibacillus sinopodophylli TaxID=1837342 RepID=UPI00110CB7DA|nr:glycosyltransferase [Paenibacillus sinopodophylli]
MKYRLLKLAMVCMSLALICAPLHVEAIGKEQVTTEKQCLSPSTVQFQNQLRKLWIDHVVWTRNYIVSAVAGMDDQQKVLERLLKNQQDIGDAIKPYYGEAAGNKLAELLREHIVIAGKIVEAAKQGNQADVEKYNKDWYKNADEIALFLSSANPNLSKKQLTDLLYMHLQLVTDTVTARLTKNWDADIVAFDKGIDHIIVLADTLSEAIVRQFPTQFK